MTHTLFRSARYLSLAQHTHALLLSFSVCLIALIVLTLTLARQRQKATKRSCVATVRWSSRLQNEDNGCVRFKTRQPNVPCMHLKVHGPNHREGFSRVLPEGIRATSFILINDMKLVTVLATAAGSKNRSPWRMRKTWWFWRAPVFCRSDMIDSFAKSPSDPRHARSKKMCSGNLKESARMKWNHFDWKVPRLYFYFDHLITSTLGFNGSARFLSCDRI